MPSVKAQIYSKFCSRFRMLITLNICTKCHVFFLLRVKMSGVWNLFVVIIQQIFHSMYCSNVWLIVLETVFICKIYRCCFEVQSRRMWTRDLFNIRKHSFWFHGSLVLLPLSFMLVVFDALWMLADNTLLHQRCIPWADKRSRIYQWCDHDKISRIRFWCNPHTVRTRGMWSDARVPLQKMYSSILPSMSSSINQRWLVVLIRISGQKTGGKMALR